jgi:hypothetical protein
VSVLIIRLALLCTVTVGVCLSAAESSGGSGLAIAPGLSLIENVIPGKPLDLAVNGLPITIFNKSAGVLTAELVFSDYQPYSLASFECGFEYLPDKSWVTVTPLTQDIPGGEQRTGSVVLNIPDRPECWNRHYVVCVETGVPVRTALGATLRMQARILVETAAKDQPANVGPRGELGVTPSRISMVTGTDQTWSGTTTVMSSANAEATYDVLSIGQVYPPALADRHSRFFGTNVTAQTVRPWAIIEPSSFSLAAGATQRLTCTAKPERQPNGQERIDEVFFIARRALPSADAKHCREVAGHRYDRMELVRLIYTTPTTP